MSARLQKPMHIDLQNPLTLSGLVSGSSYLTLKVVHFFDQLKRKNWDFTIVYKATAGFRVTLSTMPAEEPKPIMIPATKPKPHRQRKSK